MIGDHLREVPPRGNSVDYRETAFTTAILQTAERVAPPRERRLPRRGWMGDAQTEEEVNMFMTARQAALKRQKAQMQNRQLKRAIPWKNTCVRKVCDAAYERFLGK